MIHRHLRLRCLSPMDLTEQMLLSFLEELVCKLPSVRDDLPKAIGVELANKAREVVVLEVVGKKVAGKLRRAPYDKGGVVFAPRDDVIGGRVVDKLVSLGEKWGRNRLVAV